jgi:hypothetical protein
MNKAWLTQQVFIGKIVYLFASLLADMAGAEKIVTSKQPRVVDTKCRKDKQDTH